MSISEFAATIRYFWMICPEHRAFIPLLLLAYLLSFPIYWFEDCRKFLKDPPRL